MKIIAQKNVARSRKRERNHEMFVGRIPSAAEVREAVEPIWKEISKPGEASRDRKVVRLHRCFGCEQNFAQAKMSSFLVLCRKCLCVLRSGEPAARSKFIA
jgi:hypothetical protein